jgi:arylamine N-acetyltransferase
MNVDLDRYLERIGLYARPAAEVEGLFEPQRRHLLAVPFDALDCHLGNRVSVLPRDAHRKVVEHRRWVSVTRERVGGQRGASSCPAT